MVGGLDDELAVQFLRDANHELARVGAVCDRRRWGLPFGEHVRRNASREALDAGERPGTVDGQPGHGGEFGHRADVLAVLGRPANPVRVVICDVHCFS